MNEPRSLSELKNNYRIKNRWYYRFLFTAVALTVVGVVITIVLLLSNQRSIEEQIEETKRQGIVNQQYIRCLALITERPFTEKVLDDCAEQSRLP
jgi:hypothetical protein